MKILFVCFVEALDAKDGIISEAKITSDKEFREYAYNLLKKAHGDKYDSEIADKFVQDLLITKRIKNSYGVAIGMLQASLFKKD